MTVERAEPPLVAQERQMLDAWLDFHRDTLAVKCDGRPASGIPIADCADLTVVPTAGADRAVERGVELCLVGTTRVEGADSSSIG